MLIALTANTATRAQSSLVQTARTASFSPDAVVPESVRAECNVEAALPRYLAKKSRQRVQVVDPPFTSTRVLRLDITQIIANPGGAWSGRKSISANGTLLESDKIIGSFRVTRLSRLGGFGQGFSSTCSVLNNAVDNAAEEIAAWLLNPTMDALLGTAEK